jgi:hypothetical protein
MGKKSECGSGMNNPDHITESLKTNFLGLKFLNSLMWIRDPGWKKLYPGFEMEKCRIRDKPPGSATLIAYQQQQSYYYMLQ